MYRYLTTHDTASVRRAGMIRALRARLAERPPYHQVRLCRRSFLA